jgi:hypothetical protein
MVSVITLQVQAVLWEVPHLLIPLSPHTWGPGLPLLDIVHSTSSQPYFSTFKEL